jgi:L-threonylcarbamoyladenylate synthase
MNIYTKEDFLQYKFNLLKDIDAGKLFIHPTDTIYGIGCDATNEEAVMTIRTLKNRPEQSFKVIAPSKQWIIENCIIPEEAYDILAQLPGPVSLKLLLKNPSAVCKAIHPTDNYIGIRLPNHWITKVVEAYGKPVLTTSANKVGERFMVELDDLDSDIKGSMHFMINEGALRGQHSQMHDFTLQTKPL